MSLSEQDVPEAGGGRGFSINVRYLRAVGENAVLDCVGHPHCISMPFLLLLVTEGDRNVGGMIGPVRQKSRVQTCPDFLAMADIDGQPPSLGKGLARTSS